MDEELLTSEDWEVWWERLRAHPHLGPLHDQTPKHPNHIYVEPREGGYFAAWLCNMGIVAYGTSEEEATERLQKALRMLLERMAEHPIRPEQE